MLTDSDIELIKESRKEIYANRTMPIIIFEEQDDIKDPITGFPEPQDPIEHNCDAIVTEVSTVSNVQRSVVDGVELRKGDVLFHIDYDELPETVDEPETIEYKGLTYDVISVNHKGLGRLNRVECLGRRRS